MAKKIFLNDLVVFFRGRVFFEIKRPKDQKGTRPSKPIYYRTDDQGQAAQGCGR